MNFKQEFWTSNRWFLHAGFSAALNNLDYKDGRKC
jgi:hypothetical protein